MGDEILKHPNLLDLINKIYAAGLDSSLWQDCMDEIQNILNGRVGFFYTFDASKQETIDFFFTSDSDPEWMNKFLSHYIHTNPYPQPIHEIAPAGIPLIDDMVLSRDEARNTDYYKGWVQPQGLDITQVGCKVTIDKDRFVTLGTHVDPLTIEDQSPYYHSILSTLIPHITRSIKINQVLKEQQQLQKNLHGIFDRLDIAILLLDHKYRVQTSNDLAKKLLQHADLILTDPHSGKLKAADKKCDEKFYKALKKCFGGKIISSQQTFSLTSTIDAKRFVTWIQPANQEHLEQFGAITPSIHTYQEKNLIAVLISVPQTHTGPPVEIVQSILGVTLAEARLAAALANGETLQSYAIQAHISHNTARGQLSSIFHKTGIKRQAELVAHIWRSFGPLRF